MEDFIKKVKAVMIGHAVGDALGVPVEFCKRDYLDRHPVTEMLGYGAYEEPKGAWSDDTSMSLCTLDSLAKGTIDFDDIMKNFGKWYYEDQFTPTGYAFDMGRTCSAAIDNYFKNKLPYDKCGLSDEYSNGNGSLMRIHPVTLYLIYTNSHKNSLGHWHRICEVSSLTHAHLRSRLACVLYSFILWQLILNPHKQAVMDGLRYAIMTLNHYTTRGLNVPEDDEMTAFSRIFDGIEKQPRDLIKSSGYVVHTLEAALWCLLTTDSYKECVLKAVNLGGDTDTTAAVAGGLAGALYGYDAIPEEWKQTLLRREYIEELCEKAFNKKGDNI